MIDRAKVRELVAQEVWRELTMESRLVTITRRDLRTIVSHIESLTDKAVAMLEEQGGGKPRNGTKS